MSDDQEQSVNIRFTKSDDYRSVAATGICGGATPNGEIVAHLFVEQQQLPEKLILQLDPATGKVREATADVGPNTYIRELQMGLVLRPDIARSVGEWLIGEANKAMQMGLKPQNKQAI